MFDKTENWKEGDYIIDCRWQKVRKIKEIKRNSSFIIIKTCCNKTIIAEDIDFLDLVLPEFIFDTRGKDE